MKSGGKDKEGGSIATGVVSGVGSVVLAGDNPGTDPLREAGGAPCKCLIRIGGKPMLGRVVEALRGCPLVGRIVIVGPSPALYAELGRGTGVEVGGAAGGVRGSDTSSEIGSQVVLVDQGSSIIENVKRGLAALPGEDRVLVVTGDLPFLTPAVISEFLQACRDPKVDFYYPIVDQKVVEGTFPGSHRTYVRLQEGRYTGGNAFLIRSALISNYEQLARRVVANRKNPFRLARILGLTFILKFLLGRLRLSELERRASEITGMAVRAVPFPSPEIAVDVDKVDDLHQARRILGG